SFPVHPSPSQSLPFPSQSVPVQSTAAQELQSLRLLQERPRVLHLQLHRPGKRNALDLRCWRELVQVFRDIAQDPECRAVVVSGAGAAFTAGIDLAELGSLLAALPAQDAARRAWALRRHIREFQESFSAMERVGTDPQTPKPAWGPLKSGVDLISACDIRFCSQDAYFQVKEVDMGLAADVGTLQRLPKIVGSQSLVNELAFTARIMRAPEALSCGLVSRVLPDKAALLEVALEVAEAIAARSPVAVQGTKVNLLYSRDRPVSEGLQHVATWNMAMLQTEDIPKSVQAALDKKGPEDVPFAKL
uniref:Delta(3,5)-Delta(2,4)-dienoyl-CoA isomerase, mitochondrial n=1 Tax=Taeniopygia guttata TaxID=59729 RepID=A0A674GWH7_TAEGU